MFFRHCPPPTPAALCSPPPLLPLQHPSPCKMVGPCLQCTLGGTLWNSASRNAKTALACLSYLYPTWVYTTYITSTEQVALCRILRPSPPSPIIFATASFHWAKCAWFFNPSCELTLFYFPLCKINVFPESKQKPCGFQ